MGRVAGGAVVASDPLLLLAVKVVGQAVRDARAGEADAAAWLNAGAGGILDVLDVEPHRLQRALDRPRRLYQRRVTP